MKKNLLLFFTFFSFISFSQPFFKKNFEAENPTFGFQQVGFGRVIKLSNGDYAFGGASQTGVRWEVNPFGPGWCCPSTRSSVFSIITDDSLNEKWRGDFSYIGYDESRTYNLISICADNYGGFYSLIAEEHSFGISEPSFYLVNSNGIAYLFYYLGYDFHPSNLLHDKNSGSVVIALKDPTLSNNALLLKFSDTGIVTWKKTISNSPVTINNSILIDATGNYLFAGTAGTNNYVVECDSAGTVIWAKRYSGNMLGGTVTAYGNAYYIVGAYNNNGNYDVLLQKIDLNGNTLFAKGYGTSNFEVGNSIIIVRDTIYIAAGLIKTDLSGNLIQSYYSEAYGLCSSDTASTLSQLTLPTYGGILRTNMNGGTGCLDSAVTISTYPIVVTDSIITVFQQISTVPLNPVIVNGYAICNEQVSTTCYTTTGIFNTSINKGGIDIFPNPASIDFSVLSEEEMQVIKIYDYQGKLTNHLKLNEKQFKLTVKELKNGNYSIVVITNKGTFRKTLTIIR